jgi:hypothetical protein
MSANDQVGVWEAGLPALHLNVWCCFAWLTTQGKKTQEYKCGDPQTTHGNIVFLYTKQEGFKLLLAEACS